MSKLRVINGDNVTSIAGSDREIRLLELEIEKKADPTNRDLVVYAYHFIRLGNPLLAQKYLNRLDQEYFDSGIYKDLSQALLVWSMIQVSESLRGSHFGAASEYFVVVRRIVELFQDLNFQSKPAFYRFAKTFRQFTTVPESL